MPFGTELPTELFVTVLIIVWLIMFWNSFSIFARLRFRLSISMENIFSPNWAPVDGIFLLFHWFIMSCQNKCGAWNIFPLKYKQKKIYIFDILWGRISCTYICVLTIKCSHTVIAPDRLDTMVRGNGNPFL